MSTPMEGISRIGDGLNQIADEIARAVLGSLPGGWSTMLLAVAAALLCAVTATRLLRRWRARGQLRRWHIGARLITILPPPRVDPAGGEALWANLIGLLRPRLVRWWHGQPHLAFEYLSTAEGIRIRMWVPGLIPPGLVERAITAAWPGTRTHTTHVPPPVTLLTTQQPTRRRRVMGALREMVAGGELR
ncbi:MAG: hypothetical protein ACRDXB_07890, partial [Actinomycetes bacterium]